MSSTHYMSPFQRLVFLFLLFWGMPIGAQNNSLDDSIELVLVKSKITQFKSFTYLKVTQQYITNENQYFLDLKIDSSFLIFTQDSLNKLVYHGRAFADDKGKLPWTKGSKMERKKISLRFNEAGKIVELVNWKEYRDEFMTALSAQAKSKLITNETFNEQKLILNDEANVRGLAIEDLSYLFGLYGDTFDLNIEYLRVKKLKNPFTNSYIEVLGNFKGSYPEGTKNTVQFKAENKVGSLQKQQLLEECKAYIKKTSPNDEAPTEIQSVILNSEQDYRYNASKQIIIIANFSDVLAINKQSRGNIRSFKFWDYQL